MTSDSQAGIDTAHDPDRIETTPAELGDQTYPWLTASLIPRAIAWVSSVSADGVDNVAPHSFCTVAGVDPATLCFVSVGDKDTLRNVRATGEFVLNIGSASQLGVLNDSATPLDAERSEFDEAGIARAPSRVVAPPRVADAPVAFECRVSGEHVIGSCVTVFGEIVHVSARRNVLADDGLPDPLALAPLARMGRNEWALLGEVFSLGRLTKQEWDSGRRSLDG